MLHQPTQVLYSPYFVKQFHKLPVRIQKLAIEKEAIFKQNMLHPSLKTHLLRGKLVPSSAFSVNYEYRILFSLEADGSVVSIDIGTHQIYR